MATRQEIEKAVESKGVETLPPPGYGRGEALRRRQAKLEKAIDELSEMELIGSLDPTLLEPDPYFLQHQDEMTVPNGDYEHYEYLWVETSHRGQHVDLAKRAGYLPVRKDDPDGADFMQYSPEGYPLVGSTILMKMPLEHYIRMRAKYLAEYKKRRGDVFNVDRMMEISERYAQRTGKPAVKIVEHFSPDQIRNAQARSAFRKQRQQRDSWETIDTHLKEGTAHLAYGPKEHAHI